MARRTTSSVISMWVGHNHPQTKIRATTSGSWLHVSTSTTNMKHRGEFHIRCKDSDYAKCFAKFINAASANLGAR